MCKNSSVIMAYPELVLLSADPRRVRLLPTLLELVKLSLTGMYDAMIDERNPGVEKVQAHRGSREHALACPTAHLMHEHGITYPECRDFGVSIM